MKKRIVFIIVIFMAGMLYAQEETISLSNVESTVAPNDIRQVNSYNFENGGVVVLNFEGLANRDEIQEFYNGGTSSMGNSGTDYGVTFTNKALGLIDFDAGGTGNFANEPSPSTIMFWLEASPTPVMNYADGFTTGFSFYYTTNTSGGGIEVYSEMNGTGTLLGSASLPVTPPAAGDPNGGTFGTWQPVGVSFTGTAKSIKFLGAADQIGFDDITFGSATPGVEPPVVDLGPDVEICEGEVLILDAGNPGSTYMWSTGETTQTINVTVEGLYWVEVTNEAGTDYDEIYVTVIPEIPCVIIVPPQPPFEHMVGNILSAMPDPSLVGWTCSSADPEWQITSDPALPMIEYTAGTGSAVFTLTYDNGCIWTCSVTITSYAAWEHCTMTQGFYGNEGGEYCDDSGTEELMASLLAPDLSIGDGSNVLYLLPSNAACLINRLPAGGPSIPIDAYSTCSNPDGIDLTKKEPKRFKNTLVGQTITLGLNLRLSCLGPMIITSPYLTTAASSGCGSYTAPNYPINADWRYNEIPASVFAYLGTSATINDLYALANDALAGYPVGGLDLEDITNALGAINDGFDGCMFGTFNGGYWPPAPQSQPVSFADVSLNEIEHTAFPNPFNESTTIEFTLPESSNVKVGIYTVNGMFVGELFTGYVESNKKTAVKLQEINLPQSVLLYVIQTDFGSYFGKLIKQ